jgi:hypothetical protein
MKKIIFLLAIVAFVSCKVQLMPVYNQSMINQIAAAKFTVDSVYDEAQAHPELGFAHVKTGYELSEIYINNIMAVEAARPKAKILADQAQRIKNVFENAYNYHAKNIVISAQTAFGFKTQIDATFDALMVSETNLNK